jgi:predicted metal-dependent hydrolase
MEIKIGTETVTVIRKRIKRLYLRVLPPDGAIEVTAPVRMSEANIVSFVRSKGGWIESRRRAIAMRPAVVELCYVDGELHPYLGELYPLRVIRENVRPCVTFYDGVITLRVRPHADVATCKAVMESWYTSCLGELLPGLFAKWEGIMGVKCNQVIIKRLKTQWGNCRPVSGVIRMNMELAKRSVCCIESVVVHELTHLLEASHSVRFYAIMTRYYPEWKRMRLELNRKDLPQPC